MVSFVTPFTFPTYHHSPEVVLFRPQSVPHSYHQILIRRVPSQFLPQIQLQVVDQFLRESFVNDGRVLLLNRIQQFLLVFVHSQTVVLILRQNVEELLHIGAAQILSLQLHTFALAQGPLLVSHREVVLPPRLDFPLVHALPELQPFAARPMVFRRQVLHQLFRELQYEMVYLFRSHFWTEDLLLENRLSHSFESNSVDVLKHQNRVAVEFVQRLSGLLLLAAVHVLQKGERLPVLLRQSLVGVLEVESVEDVFRQIHHRMVVFFLHFSLLWRKHFLDFIVFDFQVDEGRLFSENVCFGATCFEVEDTFQENLQNADNVRVSQNGGKVVLVILPSSCRN